MPDYASSSEAQIACVLRGAGRLLVTSQCCYHGRKPSVSTGPDRNNPFSL